MSSRKRDTVYQNTLAELADFTFDQQVTSVFEDMINRSVPGYASIVHNLTQIATQFVQANTNCYDLGCSLGASSLAMRTGVENKIADKNTVTIISVDTSQDMLKRAKGFIDNQSSNITIELQHDDIRNTVIDNASMVVLNFTLQFLPIEDRSQLLKKIYAGMNQGACLILSEKVCFKNSVIQEMITNLHHQFKREQGYSELEIAQKRDAIENIMKLETQEQHIKRLQKTGFQHVSQWHQNTAFCSFLAIK